MPSEMQAMEPFLRTAITPNRNSTTLFQTEIPGNLDIPARSDYKYEIEYEYDFRISNQLRSQNRHFSLQLISRKGGSRKKIGVTHYSLKHANSILKVVFVPHLVHALRSEGLYFLCWRISVPYLRCKVAVFKFRSIFNSL